MTAIASTTSPPRGVQTVDKAVDLLDRLAHCPEGATNAELARAVELDKSTAHRLLSTLERRGLVRRDPATRRFVLGRRMLELALGSEANPALAARPWLHRLVERSGESASLSLLVDRQFVSIDSVQAPHEMRFAPEVGGFYDLNAGATGKAILAFDDALADAVLGAGDLRRYTARTVVDSQELQAELRAVRAIGLATSSDERVLGGASIASPVFGPAGAVIGALAISSVAVRCPLDRLLRFADDVRHAATATSRSLGAPADR